MPITIASVATRREWARLRMGMRFSGVRALACLITSAAMCIKAIVPVHSADLPPTPVPVTTQPAALTALSTSPEPGDQIELRFGAFLHGVGSAEKNTFDLSGAVLTPRLNFFGVRGDWAYLIPRVQIGGNVNLSGRTSFGYADFAWTAPITDWLFVEPFFGGAIHNGSLSGTPTMSDLGCRELFHVGASIGVPLAAHWSVVGTFEHLSNGKYIFGTDCGTNQSGATGGGNQGLNNYGLRISYVF
jgi:lipid A 3-O-deacylase